MNRRCLFIFMSIGSRRKESEISSICLFLVTHLNHELTRAAYELRVWVLARAQLKTLSSLLNICIADSRIFSRLSPFSLAVSTLAPDLSFEYYFTVSLAFAKNTTVLQSMAQKPEAPSDGFLSCAFKCCYKLFGVLLKLYRFILGCAKKNYLFG